MLAILPELTRRYEVRLVEQDITARQRPYYHCGPIKSGPGNFRRSLKARIHSRLGRSGARAQMRRGLIGSYARGFAGLVGVGHQGGQDIDHGVEGTAML